VPRGAVLGLADVLQATRLKLGAGVQLARVVAVEGQRHPAWADYTVKLYADAARIYPGKPCHVRIGRRPDGRWVYQRRIGSELDRE
jgi:hypothetical protein